MRWLVLGFLAVLGSACVIRNHCTPNNCDGCCDVTGMCLAGNTTDACGIGGASCSACMSGSCSSGACFAPTAGGVAGGTAMAGGTASATSSVIFLWRFAGQTCAEAAVSNVVVNVPGSSVRSQVFRCNTSGTDGVVVQGFAPGSYTATLEGRDASNVVKFRGTASLRIVNQDVSAQVTLDRVMATGPGDVLVRWALPPLTVSATPTCTQATITKVSVSVNGGTPSEVGCSVGEPSGSGFVVRNVTGTVQLELSAADSNGFVYFKKREQVTAMAATSTPVTVALGWAVGSLPVRWAFRDGTATKTCAEAGVTSVYLNLRTQQGQLLYPNAGAEVPCSEAMAGQATIFPYLPEGSFDVFFQAVGTGGRLFKTNQTTPPVVMVQAGVFPTLDASTPTYVLTP